MEGTILSVAKRSMQQFQVKANNICLISEEKCEVKMALKKQREMLHHDNVPAYISLMRLPEQNHMTTVLLI